MLLLLNFSSITESW